MKAVLVDDEYYALEGLKMELLDLGGIQVAGMFQDGAKFLDEIEKISPDVVFLDIEMPKYNGFELLEKLLEKGITTNIVFVTAYDHYAVKAFEINAVDYILKPATKDRLKTAIERIKPDQKIIKTQNIQISCFKHFSILSDGKEINRGWRTRKAEELIAYLLCKKGKYTSKEKIAEDLWPEQDGEKSLSNLYLAYYYIKKQEMKTGVRIPIESERGKMRINLDSVECDLLSFDKLIEETSNMHVSEALSKLEKAVELYQGTVFEDGYYFWSDGVQRHYEILYQNVLSQVVEYYKKKSDEAKTAYYEKKMEMV
ncbi:MAG: response regulator [Clostridia bacterium]|nr:response regulator [Clostridia bacterium]